MRTKICKEYIHVHVYTYSETSILRPPLCLEKIGLNGVTVSLLGVNTEQK